VVKEKKKAEEAEVNEKVATKKPGVGVTHVKMHQEEPAAKKGRKSKEPQKEQKKGGGKKEVEVEEKVKCPMESIQQAQNVLEKPGRLPPIPPINIYAKEQQSTNTPNQGASHHTSPPASAHQTHQAQKVVHDENEL